MQRRSYGDLAGILTLATQKERPLSESDPSVVQVKMVAGVRFGEGSTRWKITMAV